MVKLVERSDKGGKIEFSVHIEGQNVVPSITISEVLQRLPEIDNTYVYVDDVIFSDAEKWLKKEIKNLLNTKHERTGE